MRKLFAFGLLIAGSVLLGGCEKDSDKEDDGGYYIEMVLDAIYVVNTGNAAASIPASITVVDVKNHRVTQDVYRKQNGRDMEGIPSDMLMGELDNRVFIAYPDKDILEVIEGPSMKSLQKISTTGLFGDKGKGPKKMIWHWHHLLVLTDAGYVLSFSGDTLEAEAAYEVGPGSTAMYSMGKYVIEVLHPGQAAEVPRISRVYFDDYSNPYTLTSEELLTNPVEYIRVYSDNYAAFILNAGKDGQAGSVILRQWNQEPALRKIADATFACNGYDTNGNALFMVNTATGGKPTYSRYNILTDSVSPFVEDGEQYPTAIAADYVWHNTICVTSRPTANKNGTENGHITIYDANGNLLGKYEAGVNPSLIGFGYVEERK